MEQGTANPMMLADSGAAQWSEKAFRLDGLIPVATEYRFCSILL